MRKVTIGSTSKLTVEKARDAARKILARAELGEDVAAERAKARADLTVAELCDQYLAEAEQGHVISKRGAPKKASTLVSDRGRIVRHIKPLLGTKRVSDVERADIERFPARCGKREDGSGRQDEAAGSCHRQGRSRHRDADRAPPRRHLHLRDETAVACRQSGAWSREVRRSAGRPVPEHGRTGAAGGGSAGGGDDRAAWNTKADAPGAKHLPKAEADRRSVVGPHAAAAIRLLILTGCRLREILTLRWRDVDFERGLLLLPDSKTGAKAVVIGAPALEVLAAIPGSKAVPTSSPARSGTNHGAT